MPSQFPFLIKYSPLQNVKPGTCYPATLVTTADHDDRVVPSHSFKFTAAMQAAQGCSKPVLIRVETGGSHGYRPTDKQIAERADQWAFAAAAMGVKTVERLRMPDLQALRVCAAVRIRGFADLENWWCELCERDRSP